MNGDEPIADDLNLYAYCGNDWIDWIDSDGCSSYSFIKYSYYKTTWSKEKLKIERNYFVIPLTYYMETEHGGTLTWTQDKSFSVSISADLGISVKVLSAKLGLQFSWTLDHSSSYSYSLDRKKGKYAIIVARIDAQVYKVIKTVYTRKEYYKSGFLSFTYRAKSEMISDQNSAKMYVPIKSSTSIKLVYSNRKTYK